MGLLKLLRDMAIGADVIRHQSDLIRSQDETIAMHAEEIHLLEVELAASKNAEALIDKESDLYAAEIRALDQAVVFLYDLAVDKLGPIGAEMKRMVQDPAYIDGILADGADRARVIATETMTAVKDILGFVRR